MSIFWPVSDWWILASPLHTTSTLRYGTWLLPDDDSERIIEVVGEPYDQVNALVSDLAEQVAVFSAWALKLFAKHHSVFEPNPLEPCASRNDVVARISQAIAREVARDYEPESTPSSRWSVSRFGSGRGIMMQETLSSSAIMYQQHCFMISRNHRLCEFYFAHH